MKLSMLIRLALCGALLSGCTGDTPTGAIASPNPTPPAATTTSTDSTQAEYALKQQLRPFMSDRRVYESPAVVTALEATRVAQIEWVQARDAHPALAAQVEKAERLMAEASQEAQSGNTDLARQRAADAGAAKAELEQAALKRPDLAALNQARQAAQRSVERAQVDALKSIPEARALAEQWEALLDSR